MTGAIAPHEPDAMGAHAEDGTVWLPRSRYSRSQARTWFSDFAGVRWIDVSVLARWMVHAPDDPCAAEYGGEYWCECSRETPGAFRVWRCG